MSTDTMPSLVTSLAMTATPESNPELESSVTNGTSHDPEQTTPLNSPPPHESQEQLDDAGLKEPPKSLDTTKQPSKITEFKIHIPRISSRDLHPQQAHSPVDELEQREFLFVGPGAKREPNKLTVKLKSPELEECIKRAKKYAMEQSVRFVLVKQQQQQQKQQLDLIKKQQALLLMCR